MRNKRVLIWSTAIGDLLEGKTSGIAVQLYFWANSFAKNGWEVTSYTYRNPVSKNGVDLKRINHWGKFEIFHEWLFLFCQFVSSRPQLIISRGVDRAQFPIAVLSRLFGVKYVFFAASDRNFEPEETVAGPKRNTLMFKKALKYIDYFVVQNQYQQDTLMSNYGKSSIILFNPWGTFVKQVNESLKCTDVIWVANLRRLKRAEWIVNAAAEMPDIDFTIVGGSSTDTEEATYYKKIEKEALKYTNLHFLGAKDFSVTNNIISKARLLCCTSIFEGFPNTFLQAWAYNKPVISTVNPSDLITKNHLGFVVKTENEFQRQVRLLLSNQHLYDEISNNIMDYFSKNHDMDTVYKRLLGWLQVK